MLPSGNVIILRTSSSIKLCVDTAVVSELLSLFALVVNTHCCKSVCNVCCVSSTATRWVLELQPIETTICKGETNAITGPNRK